MAIRTSYSDARANLASLWDSVTEDRETVIVSRRGKEDVAIIAADELSGLLETAHLLRSPANAERLRRAMRRVAAGEGEVRTVESLRQEFGVDPQE